MPALVLAPRALPMRLTWRLLFGSPIALFGWVFAAFGMVFTLLFLPLAAWPFDGHDAEAVATVTHVDATSASENKQRIYRVDYTFTRDGTELRGSSYTSEPPHVGGHRRVEFDSADPSDSRLVGMRHKPFGWWVVVVTLFPLVGVGLGVPQLRRGLLERRLLRHGVPTFGRIVLKQPTNVRVNDQPVMALTFEYQPEASGSTYRAVVETLEHHKLEDDLREPMLYDPYAPWRATTLDHLPGSPRITADGRLEARPGIAVHVLIAPVIFACELVIGAAMLVA